MKQQILDELSTFLSDMERELACCNETELRKRQLTSRIIRGTLALMLVLLLANSWYLYKLSTGLSDNLRMVDTMAEQFGHVTGSLQRMTGAVGSINRQFLSLDEIDLAMETVTGEVSRINQSLAGIAGTVSGLSGELYHIDRSMLVMDGQVFGMSGNVQQIGGSVNKMAGPMSFMNSIMPW